MEEAFFGRGSSRIGGSITTSPSPAASTGKQVGQAHPVGPSEAWNLGAEKSESLVCASGLGSSGVANHGSLDESTGDDANEASPTAESLWAVASTIDDGSLSPSRVDG